MSPAQQQVLFDNTARSIGGAPLEIQLRHVRNSLKADPAYGKGVAEALGVEVPNVEPQRRVAEARPKPAGAGPRAGSSGAGSGVGVPTRALGGSPASSMDGFLGGGRRSCAG
jgi:hypothetical protein